MSSYAKTKIYFDGSHYIGIPHTIQTWKKRKCKDIKTTNKVKEKFERLCRENRDKAKNERKEIIENELIHEFENKETVNEYVNKQFERKRRNDTERKKRLYRKVYLQEWDYFCTFTYDRNKLNEKRKTN